MAAWLTTLRQSGVSPELVEFAQAQPSLLDLWNRCPRGDWIVWLAAHGFAAPASSRDIVDGAVILAGFSPAPTWRRMFSFAAAPEDALRWLVQDCGRFDALPAIDRLGTSARAYLDYRAAILGENPAAAMSAARALATDHDPRSTAVRVDVGLRINRRDGAGERALVASEISESRFVARVGTVARVANGEPAQDAIDAFLGRFGNEFELWRNLAALADRVPGLVSGSSKSSRASCSGYRTIPPPGVRWR